MIRRRAEEQRGIAGYFESVRHKDLNFKNSTQLHERLTVLKIPAWVAGVRSEQIFHSGDMKIDHKSGAGRPLWSNMDHLRLKVKARSMSMVRRLRS
ncbi:hypothetical protein TNCV_220611 [Trichonephila clavipes]|nr:hypothetical protein TNCV_220611 [Trichonephila clavipes]